MSSYLERYFDIFEFGYLGAGAQDVRLDHDEQGRQIVVGKWSENARELWGPGRPQVVRELVNRGRTPDAILDFTRAYGPLHGPRQAGAQFRFQTDAWKGEQEYFRWLWKNARQFTDWAPEISGDDKLEYRRGRLVFTTAHLYFFLYLSLCTCHKELLRKCERPGCPHPYFIALHPPQRYCSDECSRWAKLKAKLKWWNRDGKKRAAKKKDKKRSKKRR